MERLSAVHYRSQAKIKVLTLDDGWILLDPRKATKMKDMILLWDKSQTFFRSEGYLVREILITQFDLYYEDADAYMKWLILKTGFCKLKNGRLELTTKGKDAVNKYKSPNITEI